MVYKAGDIKHLEAMGALAEKQPQEIDVKSLLGLNASDVPTFEENILKLCEGLRTKGFDKYALNLEERFLEYKKAGLHLYKTHKEEGEDLIEFAHPDGDVNMGDGEHGDVETIVSKHKKIIDVVQKEPNGKLASYVMQCKIALAQSAAGLPSKEIISGLMGPYNELNSLKSKLSSLIHLPEIENDNDLSTKFSEAYGAINSLILWANDLMKVAQSAPQRATQLSPSKGLVSVQDINSVAQDPRYENFAQFLTVIKSPSEIFGKFASLANYASKSVYQIASSIQNEEIRKNLIAALSGHAPKMPQSSWVPPSGADIAPQNKPILSTMPSKPPTE